MRRKHRACMLGTLTGMILTSFFMNFEDGLDGRTLKNHSRDTTNCTQTQSNDTIAKHLTQLFNITCVVLAKGNEHEGINTSALLKTWGRRCTNIYIQTDDAQLSSRYDNNPVKKNLYTLSAAFSSYTDSNWFIVLEGDTYVIMENLRYFLYEEARNLPTAFGQLSDQEVVWMDGLKPSHAVTLFSNKALETLLEDYTQCQWQSYEFWGDFLSACLKKIKISCKNLNAEKELKFNSGLPVDYFDFKVQNLNQSTRSHSNRINLSRHAVTFHTNSWQDMMELDYLIYRLTPQGHTRSYAWS